MHQPDHRRDDHREQAQRVPVVLTHDVEALDPANPVFDVDAHRGQPAILRTLRLRQLTAARLAPRRLNTCGATCGAEVSQVVVLQKISGCTRC